MFPLVQESDYHQQTVNYINSLYLDPETSQLARERFSAEDPRNRRAKEISFKHNERESKSEEIRIERARCPCLKIKVFLSLSSGKPPDRSEPEHDQVSSILNDSTTARDQVQSKKNTKNIWTTKRDNPVGEYPASNLFILDSHPRRWIHCLDRFIGHKKLSRGGRDTNDDSLNVNKRVEVVDD